MALIGLGAGLVPLGLILLFVVAVSAGRTEPDPDAERPAALYYAGIQFVTVFAVLFAIFSVVSSLLNLTIDDQFSAVSFGFEDSEEVASFSGSGEDDGDWSSAILALIAGGVAAGLYWFHDKRRRLRREGSVGARVRRTYLYAVSFVAVVIALVTSITALYAVVKLVAPGVTQAGTRGEAGVELAQTAVLALLAIGLALWHLREAEPDRVAIDAAPSIPPEPPGPPPPAPSARAVKASATKRAAPLKARGR